MCIVFLADNGNLANRQKDKFHMIFQSSRKQCVDPFIIEYLGKEDFSPLSRPKREKEKVSDANVVMEK
jgi:hypothetical protein